MLLKGDILDVLLPEIVSSLAMLYKLVPNKTRHWLVVLTPLLEALNEFNQNTRDLDKEDLDDLAWHGVFGKLR